MKRKQNIKIENLRNQVDGDNDPQDYSHIKDDYLRKKYEQGLMTGGRYNIGASSEFVGSGIAAHNNGKASWSVGSTSCKSK